jgi:NRAMP (natural resistance-associated macrophage protein)-like metal ion transporter
MFLTGKQRSIVDNFFRLNRFFRRNSPIDFKKRLQRLIRHLKSKSRLLALLSVLGPGLIAANAGNDAGGIATYSIVGARYGYQLIWMMLLITISLGVVQEMCARMGAATGKGLSDLIREQFGIRSTVAIMFCLLIANTGTTISEFIGIAASMQLLGIPSYISVPVVAAGLWWLIVKGSYKYAERGFLLMTTVFLAYIASAFLSKPDWKSIASSVIHPKIYFDRDYLLIFIATVGTTITPYMQIYAQSAVVEKGITMKDYSLERIDSYIGVLFSNLIAIFIIISTAATLHINRIEIETAADAARALGPVAGHYAEILFAVGLFGASMLGAAILPLSTAYSLSEALGFENGISKSFLEAPIFMSIFTGLIVLGAIVAIIPGLPLLKVLVMVQVINGLLLPVILISILLLINRREVMGEYTNNRFQNFLGWATAIIVGTFSLIMVITTILK